MNVTKHFLQQSNLNQQPSAQVPKQQVISSQLQHQTATYDTRPLSIYASLVATFHCHHIQLKSIQSFYVILHFQSGQPVQSSNPGAPGAIVSININATPQQVGSPVVSLTCNWTEHTSPEGFKYYYNSITRESKVRNDSHHVNFSQILANFVVYSYELLCPCSGRSLKSMCCMSSSRNCFYFNSTNKRLLYSNCSHRHRVNQLHPRNRFNSFPRHKDKHKCI